MSNIKQELAGITGLISLPEVYLSVRRLLDDQSSDVGDFARVVGVDPDLSARVLRLVNSAYFGLAEPVDSIPRALNLIGLDQLHDLVLGVSAVTSLDLPNEILPLRPFWHNSLYVGVLARLLAGELGLDSAERVFVAGLLHNIGHLVLCAKMPDFAREAARVSAQSGQPLHQVQQQILGCHYGEIGAMLLAQWNLPQALQELVRFQPTPLLATGRAVETALLHLAHACTGVADPRKDDNWLEADIRGLIELDAERIARASDAARRVSIEMGRAILG